MRDWANPLFWKFMARQIRRRPGRTLLTLLGIVIGVAASVAIAVTVSTTNSASRAMFETLTGRAALEIVADGAEGFDAGLSGRLESLSGVKAAVPVIQRAVLLLSSGGPVSVLALGVDPTRDGAARDYHFREGQPLRGEQDVLLEAVFARDRGLAVGSSVRLLVPTGVAELRVAGLLEPKGAAVFNGGAVVIMPLASAQRLFGLAGQVNAIHIVLAEGATLHQIESEVASRLPTGLRVQTPGTRGELAQEILFSWQETLRAMSLVALVAGAFVIMNAFLMNLGERRRQLAILRALGATRAQLARLLLREAALLGVVGTVLGIVVGLGLAVAFSRAMGRLMGVTLPGLHLTVQPFFLAVLLGPGMALLATYVPVRRATRQPPLPALLDKDATRAATLRRWPCFLGLVMVAVQIAFVLGFVKGLLPRELLPLVAPAVMALFLAGFVLGIPLFLGPLTRGVGRVAKPLLGMEGRLAFQQLARQQARTGLTVGALVIALVVAIGLGDALLNGIRRYDDYYRRSNLADFLLQGSMPGLAMVSLAPLPETLAQEIAELDAVEHVDKCSFVMARAAGRPVLLLARTFAAERPLPLDLAVEDADAVRRGLLQGEVVLGTAFALRTGLRVGEQIKLETAHGSVPLRIAGTTNEWTAYGLTMHMEWDAAKRLLGSEGVHYFAITARNGASAELADRLQAFSKTRGLHLLSFAHFRSMVDLLMGGVLGLIWVLVALVFVVASLGIVNTLTMNLLEQTREFGVLRAIGMRRAQLRKMILSQALGIGLVSLVPGALMGVGLSYLTNLVTYPLLGLVVEFRPNLTFVAGCCLAALAIAVLAAVFPARRAGRLEVVRALQYE